MNKWTIDYKMSIFSTSQAFHIFVTLVEHDLVPHIAEFLLFCGKQEAGKLFPIQNK